MTSGPCTSKSFGLAVVVKLAGLGSTGPDARSDRDPTTIRAGRWQTYTTIAVDAAGNLIGDVSSSAVLAISPDGTCGAGMCTASERGPHTVTSTYSGLSATAMLDIRRH